MMSNIDEDKKFREMADAFIAIANKQCKSENPSMVNASFLYAAARFNIFILAASSGSANEFESKKEDSLNALMAEYKKMLEDHFENYKENFEKHTGK
ncbi:MAG: DUF3144 domain-containing protein [Desulfobulbaceae bacterium]|uniref:DUF3144 domain-containing protein n=1 Tax=Candidatus Desulfobia pelagia TaxID=2841692 RepID=A0A8J6TC47_9BACT|nr:DUF3144 domain-containing protein [Candidatus Desulfobia pelagia]